MLLMSPAHTDDAVVLANGVSREYLLYHRVCPRIIGADGTLVVATAPDAMLPDALDDLAVAYRRLVVAEEMPRHEVERLIARLTSGGEPTLTLAHADDDDVLVADVRDVANSAPVAAYVNFLVGEAVRARASDIHLEGTRTRLLVRFRLDGMLVPAPDAPVGLEAAVLSRLKLMAELDIAERRRPQDGRIRVRLADRELDVRVSTVPTLHGESVVLRVLDRGGRPVALDALGMPPSILERIATLAHKPHGMVLVTGPTGSGKTTTLYSALRLRDAAAEKIITVEDPIEYQLPGITQVPVHTQAGVSFATVLRSILRQDPDVLMVGEMRDGETAALAIQAAMTGHLVFSTLHTNDALGAIPRLVDLGVPSYLVAATLEAVMAQRLVRRICPSCSEPVDAAAAPTTRLLPPSLRDATLMRGAGCAECRGTGYSGRLGVFEIVALNDAMRDAVARGAPRGELATLAEAGGWRALVEDGWTKVGLGLTTVEEVLRVGSV
ncbi:MAG: GspE/PulE family protein [Gemmatimonadaceae bacterium]